MGKPTFEDFSQFVLRPIGGGAEKMQQHRFAMVAVRELVKVLR